MVAAIKVRRSCISENRQFNDQKTQTLLSLGVNSGAPLVAPVVFWIPLWYLQTLFAHEECFCWHR